jgi:uncharacterized membrane protein
MNREVQAALIATLVIFSVFYVAQPLLPASNPSQFSVFAMLGPGGMLSGYPTSVLARQPFQLYGYVENHMGYAEYYQLRVKLGNESTYFSNLTGTNAELVFLRASVVQNNQTFEFPVSISLNQTALNDRVIFELWSYSPSQAAFVYSGLWSAIWVNVTS